MLKQVFVKRKQITRKSVNNIMAAHVISVDGLFV